MTPNTPKRAPKGSGSLYRRTVKTKNPKTGEIYEYLCYEAQISIRDPKTNKRVYISGTGATPQQALSNRTRNLQKRLSTTGLVVRTRKDNKSITMKSYLPQWLSKPTKKGTKLLPQSKQQHERRFEQWISPRFGNTAINTITKNDIQDFLYRELDMLDCAPTAKINVHKTLRALFNSAVEDEIISISPMVGITPPKTEAKANIIEKAHSDQRTNIAKYLLRWLSNEDCPYHQHYPFILFMFLGIRRAELLGIEWKSIHQIGSKTPKLTINQQLIRNVEDGSYSIQHSTKTGNSRNLILPQLWKEALKQQKEQTKDLENSEWSSLVFRNLKTGKHLTYNDHNRLWHEILEAYMTKDGKEYDKELHNWRPHGNRKITASILASEGVSVQTAQSILGHQSEAMTFYYTTLSDKAQEQGMTLLEQAISMKKK